MSDLTNPTLLIAALSIATERLTEITKGFCPYLNTEFKDDPEKEARRKPYIQILAMFCGLIVSAMSYPITSQYFENFFKPMPESLLNLTMIISLGLLASGGSGAWNSILGFILKLKS